MIALETIREKLGTAETWVESRGAHWLNPGALSVRELAGAMNAVGARFVTITAYQLPGNEGFRLEYHWDADGQLLGVPFAIASSSIESIFDMCEAADWIEREVHEGFAIDFTGRDYEPLLLRAGDTAGVNLRDPGAAQQGGNPASGMQGQEVAK
jgi:NADH:ubiquinone oxidoreductase subunit C